MSQSSIASLREVVNIGIWTKREESLSIRVCVEAVEASSYKQATIVLGHPVSYIYIYIVEFLR